MAAKKNVVALLEIPEREKDRPKGNMKTIVYILAQDPDSERTAMVERLFDNELFRVHVTNIATPKEENTPDLGGSQRKALNRIEAHRILWCLHDAKKKYPDSPVAVIKDTSVSNADSDSVADIVRAALDQPKWHLCYLCKWHDRCDLYTNKKAIHGRSTIIAKSQSPHGAQAIVFSVEGRDVVLGTRPMKNGKIFPKDRETQSRPIGEVFNELTVAGSIDVITIVPNLIEFDINAARSNADYSKLTECRDIPLDQLRSNAAPQRQPVKDSQSKANPGVSSAILVQEEAVVSSGWGAWIWILIAIVLIVIIVAVFCFSRFGQYNSSQVDPNIVAAVGAVAAVEGSGRAQGSGVIEELNGTIVPSPIVQSPSSGGFWSFM